MHSRVAHTPRNPTLRLRQWQRHKQRQRQWRPHGRTVAGSMSWLFDKPTTAAYQNGNRNPNWLTTDCTKCLVPRAVFLAPSLSVCLSFFLALFLYLSVFSCFRYLYLSFISYLRVLLLLPSIVYLYLYLSPTVTAFVSLYLYLYLHLCSYSCVCTQSSNWVCRSICIWLSTLPCTFYMPFFTRICVLCKQLCGRICISILYIWILSFPHSYLYLHFHFHLHICISVYIVCIICILFYIYVSGFVSVSAFAVGSNIVVVALVTLVVVAVVVVTLPIDRWSVDRVGRNICNCQS